MKNLKIYFMTFFISMFAPIYGHALFNDTTYGGARSLGMGGAFIAVEHAGEGNLINPASFDIDQINQGSVTIMYSPLFIGLDDGTFYNGFADVSYFLSRIGVFSLNWSYLKVSTDTVSGLYSENEIVLTYSRKVASGFYGGMKINYYTWSGAKQTDFRGNTESLNASAFSVGAGCYYKIRNDFAMGAFANNLNQPRIDDQSKGKDDITRAPIDVQAGFAFNIKKILFAFDARFIIQEIDVLFGAEYWFLNKKREKFIAARLGMTLPNLGNGLNAAAGFSVFVMRELSIDYGFLIPLVTIKSIWGEHKFSMSCRF